jgi:hypothetical protein
MLPKNDSKRPALTLPIRGMRENATQYLVSERVFTGSESYSACQALGKQVVKEVNRGSADPVPQRRAGRHRHTPWPQAG